VKKFGEGANFSWQMLCAGITRDESYAEKKMRHLWQTEPRSELAWGKSLQGRSFRMQQLRDEILQMPDTQLQTAL